MKFGIYSPGFGLFSNPRPLAELAHEAEDAGWDGYFLWDHILFTQFGDAPVGDPWVTLAAMAMTTSQIKLGTLVTPMARRRPWKLAREVTTLDHLTGGRVVLGVGLGKDVFGCEFSAFGEVADDKTHAEMLDEGLDVLGGLWGGEPFSYQGKHFSVDDVAFLPRPLQKPRIPIWLGGSWPNKAPFRRAARWDGISPGAVSGGLSPEHYREMLAYIGQFRTSNEPFDMVRPAPLPVGDASRVFEIIAEYEQAGVTWWLVPIEDDMGTLDELRNRIRQGPPRL
jgi:alkanesulfonate monooxygenase SsuD/methylene tetrahydromethanopterin reductase-like flavin-dependent oxidoreductase (luciferase family)